MQRFQSMNKALRSAATSIWIILFVALAVRLGFMWQYQSSHPKQAVSVIPFLFESGNIAHSLATGHGFSSPFRVDTGPTAWMTPAFPLLLAGIFRLFGAYTFHAWEAIVLFNILCCMLACVPIFYAGKRIGEVGLAAGAAWLWAIFPNAILIPVESMWDASVSALLVATILWATLALAESDRMRDWCAYGLLWGATLMVNATLAALLPLLLGWRAYRQQLQKRSWFGRATATLAIVVLCSVPWTIRNHMVFHHFVPLRSVLGLQLWLGNNDRTQDIFRGDLHPIYNAGEREKYIAMGEIAYMHEKRQEAVRYMLSHPGREVRLIAYRFISIWSGGTPYPLKDFVETPSLGFRFVLAFNLLAALGALCGIFVLLRSHNTFWFPVAVFPVVYPWAYYLTLSLPRYRLPIDPIVLLLMAVALQQIFSRRGSEVPAAAERTRRRRRN
ncbi:MAG: glycosyltransferase family 39 protein [Candidatus Acidiferrales bacterium]